LSSRRHLVLALASEFEVQLLVLSLADTKESGERMEPEEIRTEIERRKNRARDLRLRENLWELYYHGLHSYVKEMKTDPELILPEIRESLEASEEQFAFQLCGAKYVLDYKKGKEETDNWGSRSDETTVTPVTITLSVNGERVFRFKMERSVTYGRDMPYFNETMGEIEGFIEGSWMDEISGLKQRISTHNNDVRKKEMHLKLLRSCGQT
jgi:hypothetical protein